ncbi:LysR substrate-binding domain-containing protein [Rhodovibrionaceae bacterium A322]
MRRQLPSLNALRAFEAAARHRQITEAADELCVTHGAVSRQVKQLEESLGMTLAKRGRNGLDLTESGARLLPILSAAFDLIENGVTQIKGAQEGRLMVSCPGSFAMRWLIPRLFRFKLAHPEIDLRLVTSDGPVDFSRDDLDLAIRAGLQPWAEGLQERVFMRERIGPVMSPTFKNLNEINRLADLKKVTWLHTETRSFAWDDWLSRIKQPGLRPKNIQWFEHFYFMLQAAVSGLGVAIGPEPLVADDLASGKLLAPFGFIESEQDYRILRPQRSQPGSDEFVSWLTKEVEAAPVG